MLKSFKLSKNTFFYYDIERKTLARFPSNSNLLPNGSDNSLYFGMTSNREATIIFKELFNVNDINDLSTLSFEMKCGTSSEKVEVKLNINKEGQIQIKICKNGTMFRLTDDYKFNNFTDKDFTKMLFVVDFNNLEIRFKDPEELIL